MGVLLYHKYFEWENILRIDVAMHACTSIVCYCVKVFVCVCVYWSSFSAEIFLLWSGASCFIIIFTSCIQIKFNEMKFRLNLSLSRMHLLYV